MLKALFAVSVILLPGLPVLAVPAAPTAKKAVPAAAKPAPLVCPVTGEKIASIKDAVGSSTYKGKTYYFCCPACKPMFDKNPAKYIRSAKAGKMPAAAMPQM